jgi:ABC-type glycerol-3-phosphate transport system permease component
VATNIEVKAKTNPARLQVRERQPWWLRLEIIAVYLFLIIFSIFILIPFIWPFLSAFTNKPENVSSLYLYWPKEFTWSHFDAAINGRGQALTLMRNSIVISASSVCFGLCICALGGYALSRGTFRFKRALMFSILLIQIIPGTATVLPFYLIIRNLGLINTMAGVVIGITAGSIPFMLWVMKGFFDTVPLELEEAAWIDGASRYQTLTRIVFPLALPGVGAASIISFNSAWATFFRALIAYTNLDYGMLNAMALLYMLPSFLIFIFARQYLIKGTMAGAMAGQ